MEWIRRHLRQLRWQLTLSYTAVTVISLLAVVMIVAGVFFTQILLPDYALTPQDWVNIAREQTQFPLSYLLLEDPLDAEVISKVFNDFDPVIVSQKLFLFGDLEIYARTTGVIDVLVTDSAGSLVYVSKRHQPALLEGVAVGDQFDHGLVPGLEQPLEAALLGKTDANSVYHAFEEGDGFLMAIPIFHPEVAGEVVGVLTFVLHDISTEDDRGEYFGIVFLRSLVIVLIAAALVGATFGALTAEGLAGRFRRLADSSEAWSRGDFSTRIQEESSDEIGQLAERLNGMAQELQELVQKREELAVTEERSRLARDLHDSAKQLALAASFQIATARQLFERDPQSALKNLVEAEKLVDNVRSELTDLIHELRPATMEGRDFNEVVRTYAAEWAHSSGIGVQFDIQEVEEIPLETEEALYRIMQEALANVARHSGAKQALIEVHQHDGEIQLSVRDDGSGFDEESSSSGMGLSSMQERAEAMGGFTRITSQTGAGTEVRVVLPLAKKEAEND
jgi:NarL family two-component system sensor histidine kinase LiaS